MRDAVEEEELFITLLDPMITGKRSGRKFLRGRGTYVGSHDGFDEHHPACNHNSNERYDVQHSDDIEDDITWTTKL